MSDKYIIRNCPVAFNTRVDGTYCNDVEITAGKNMHCQYCTDCVMKQIVGECKQRIQFCENCHKTADIAIDCIECDKRGEANMSRCILKLLDIQDVE